MKNLFTKALTMIMTVAMIAGCSAHPTSSTPNDTVPDNIKVKKQLIMGLDDKFPPMGFRDEDNNIVGFDLDIANEVAKRLDMELVPTPIDWSSKELELDGGKVDILWNGMTITPTRSEAMLMSPAYIKNAQIIVVGTDSDIQTVADLEGKTVAMQEGSSAAAAYEKCVANGKEKEMLTAPDNITLFEDLKIGRIDAVIIDKVVAEYYLTENGEGKLRILDEQLADEEYGFAFKKDNTEFADLVMTTVQEMVTDGTAAEISQKWFGEDVIVFDYQ